MLPPCHPLRSRKAALAVFNRFMSEWFSSQLETISGDHSNKLLRAIGDPFHFPPGWGTPGDGALRAYEAVISPIEFASSEL